jgi:hypothetical protein
MADSMTMADVSELVRMFEEADGATRPAREKAERDIDYRDGKQWTSDEEAALKKRKQPVVTFNRVQRKVDYLSGLEKQTRKDPKCFPRNPNDAQAADAATDGIRYACDDNDWDQVRSLAWDDILTPGTGVVMVGAKQGKQGIDPELRHIPWDRFFHDPHAARFDFADGAYSGIVTWMDMSRAKALWPDGEDAIEATWIKSRDSETYDDKPKWQLWADYKRKRVRIIEIYYLKGLEWQRCVFTLAGHLEQPGPSPYLDEDGKPENPLKAVSAYVDRDNNRFGAVRVMIGPQDEINKRRSKALHLINVRQSRVGLNGQQASEAIKKELADPMGVIVADKDDFEILPTNDMAAANLQMLQEAKAEIDLLGANAALAGKNENDMSGRAILAQQQGGMVEVARLFDRLRHLSLLVYRSVWARIKQYWREERWVRITDNDMTPRYVGINQPVTMIQAAAERLQGDPQAEQKLQILSQDPRAQQLFEVRNQVAELDVDIIIDEGMDTPTVQAEQFDTLVKMVPAMGPVGQSPQVIKMLVQASQLRDKDKLIEMLDQGPTPEQQQKQQAQEQIAMAGAQAEVEKTQSETVENLAQAEKTRASIVTDAMSMGQQAGLAA